MLLLINEATHNKAMIGKSNEACDLAHMDYQITADFRCEEVVPGSDQSPEV